MKKCLRFKNVCALILVVLFAITSTVFANNGDEESSNIKIVEQNIGCSIIMKSNIPLYDGNDLVIANFYKLEPKGYIIIDKKTNIPTEYSKENDNKFIVDTNLKYYYGGALQYFVQQDINLLNNDVFEFVLSDVKGQYNIKKNELVYIPPISETNNSNLPSMYLNNLTGNISHSLRTYNYNPDGICGSTASAIFFMYYNDYKDGSFVQSKYESSNGQTLIEHLRPYIDGSTPGSSISELKNGMNDYLSSEGLSYRVTLFTGSLDMFAYLCSEIESDKYPVIVGVTGHHTYSEHWVVAHGYDMTSSANYAIVNDGWGSNNIRINRAYMDSIIYI